MKALRSLQRMLLLDRVDCDLEYILTPHSKEGTILTFRNSESNSLVILGLAIGKLSPSLDSHRKSFSNWLILPSLDIQKCDAFQVLGLSFYLSNRKM